MVVIFSLWLVDVTPGGWFVSLTVQNLFNSILTAKFGSIILKGSFSFLLPTVLHSLSFFLYTLTSGTFLLNRHVWLRWAYSFQVHSFVNMCFILGSKDSVCNNLLPSAMPDAFCQDGNNAHAWWLKVVTMEGN